MAVTTNHKLRTSSIFAITIGCIGFSFMASVIIAFLHLWRKQSQEEDELDEGAVDDSQATPLSFPSVRLRNRANERMSDNM